ncbi:glycosyltransferase family 2 protein [Candidatus Woesebacteria bacterium]|nr:MAG: glycosyltransferase family 2 protein [Candidatus Woesebacteria bacterium]
MDLSIIIVSFNTRDLTLSCIESIKKTKGSLDLEIIIVDNYSHDGSVQLLEKLVATNKSNISLIANKTNAGFSKANNQGISKSRGKYILLLNSDTLVKKDALQEMVRFAETDKTIGVVGAKLLNKDGSVQASCMNLPTIPLAIKQYWLGSGNELDKFAPKSMKPTKVDAVVGAAMLITPQALESAGKLNEKYFFYFEDLDYCRLVRKKGLKVFYLPKAQIIHYHGASTKDKKNDPDAWRKLIPGSKIYHGTLIHYVFNFIIWSGTKWKNSKNT